MLPQRRIVFNVFFYQALFNKNTKLDTSVWANKDFIVLNIWASWCVPCQIEHPFLMSLKDKNKINIIGLNYKDESKNAKNFLKKYGNPYSIIGIDKKGEFAILLGAYGVPETYVVEKGKIIPASENTQAEQFLLLVETLEKHGFLQYEISNFCRPGFESRHNSNYWKGIHYLGAGPSAHSYNGYSRSWNIRNNHTYMNAIEQQTSWFETEELTSTDIYNELLLTGLRTVYGVNLHQLEQIFPIDVRFHTQVDQLCEQGLMEKKSDSIRLTKSGRLQADRIASDLFRLHDEN